MSVVSGVWESLLKFMMSISSGGCSMWRGRCELVRACVGISVERAYPVQPIAADRARSDEGRLDAPQRRRGGMLSEWMTPSLRWIKNLVPRP